jgi:diacylglycerol kinase
MTSAIESVMHWVSADRSTSGDAHQVGSAAIEDAWLTVHIVGALILRLAGSPRGSQS